MSGHWVLSVVLSAFITTILQYSEAGSSYESFLSPQGNGEDMSMESAHDNRHTYPGFSKERTHQLLLPDDYLRDLWSLRAQAEQHANPFSPAFRGNAPSDSSESTEGDDWPAFENYGGREDQTKPEWENGYQVAKREGHSLSIVNPLDVLRQRLMLEMARRRMKENQEQIKANEAILKSLGKRKDKQMKDDRGNEGQQFGKRRAEANRRRAQKQDYRTQDSGAGDFEV